MLPDGWRKGLFEEGIELISGQHVEANLVNRQEEGKPYLTGPADFPDGKIIVTKYTKYGKKFCFKNDLLITVKGSGTGKVIESDSEYVISRQLMSIRALTFDSKFTYYYLIASITRYEEAAAGLIPGISRHDVLHTPILIPPLPEQQKIAQILSTWDKAIEKLEALIAAKKKRKKALMQQLLTGKKRFSGFEGEWRQVKFEDILKIEIGGTPSRSNPDYWDDKKNTQNRWLSIANLKGSRIYDTSEYISELGVKNSNVTLVPSETIVMSFKLTIGRRAILQKPCYTNEAICALIIRDENELNNDYLYQALGVVNFDIEIDQAVKGKTLNKEKLKRLRLNLPSLKEQQKIASVLSSADNEIETHQKQLDAFKRQKKGLMQQLLTGKKRVKLDNGKPHV